MEKRTTPLTVIKCAAAPFPEHIHPQIELLYLIDGSTTILVNGQEQHMLPGDICVCFPGVVHGYKGGKNTSAVMMIFDPKLIDDFTALMKRVHPMDPLLRNGSLPDDIPICMEQLLKEIQADKNQYIIRGYLQVVIARILPLLHLVPMEPGSNDIVYGILEYLSKHYMEAVTLETLSKALGVSRSCLSHTFSKRLGVNFRTYLNTLRADHSCTLLRSTDQTIGQIAMDCGFESIRTFNRTFAQQYGLTPSEYRDQFIQTNTV